MGEPSAAAARPTDLLRILAVWLGVVGQILGGYLPVALGAPSIGHWSAKLSNPTVPAGYAFSIWGLLFSWAVVFAVWQSLPGQQANPRLRRTGWWVAGLCLCNTLWELWVPWKGMGWVSVLIIWSGLGCALAVVWSLRRLGEPLSRRERWLLQVPFSAYAGWLSAAAFVNIAASLRTAQLAWPDPRRTGVAVGILLSASVLGSVVAYLARAWSYALPVAWALVAVLVANLTGPKNATVAAVAGICAFAVLASAWLGSRRGSHLDRSAQTG